MAVVDDSIGKDTFTASLDCLRPQGLVVAFGASSGPIPTLDTRELLKRGSLFFTRLTLAHYTARRSDLDTMIAELFEVVSNGSVRTGLSQRYALTGVGMHTLRWKRASPLARRYWFRKLALRPAAPRRR